MESIPVQKVDLHTHSTASDGSFSPSEIVEEAKRKGISILSLTDHDTTNGISEAIDRGRELGVNVIPGIEVTADTSFLGKGRRRREFHVLGYYFNPESESMKELTEFFHKSRVKRNEELLYRLEELGYDISYSEMVRRCGTNFGKPNIAKLLIEKGYFRDREEAIDFLSSLKVRREKMDYREVTRLIREAGGIAVIAHPVTLGLSYRELFCFLKKAREEGISGIEVYHYKHKAEDVVVFKEICKELNLLYTGGSDFHGENKPCIDLGFLNVTVKDVKLPLRGSVG